MTEAIPQLSASTTAGFILVLARVGPLFLLAPLFSSRLVPARAKGIVAVALSIGLAPLAMRGEEVPTAAADLAGLIAKEVLVGLSFAFALACVFAAISAAGSLLDTLMGFTYGSLIDPITGAQSAVFTQVYAMVAVAVFVVIGGDEWVIQGLARTYELVPLSEFPSIGSIVSGAEGAFAQIMASALSVAAPVILALVLTDVAFGVVSRVVPQLNVFAVGFPAKIAVGLIVAGVSLPFVAGWLSDEMQSSVRSALQTLRLA